MSAQFKTLLEQGLEQAVQQQFCQLFAVLMVRPDKQALDRFKAGLDKLAQTEQTVGVLIADLSTVEQS